MFQTEANKTTMGENPTMSEKNQEPIPTEVTIHVTLNTKTNTVMVQGPIHRRAMAIKMLTAGIEIILDQPQIVAHGTNGRPTNGAAPVLKT